LYGTNCSGALLEQIIQNESILRINASIISSIATSSYLYGFSVTITASDGRLAVSSEVLVQIDNGSSGLTDVAIVSSIKRANANSSLMFDGLVSAKSYGVDAEWTAYVDGVQVIDWAASTQKLRRFTESDLSLPIEFPLSIIDLQDFMAGSSVTFRLSAFMTNSAQSNLAYSDVSILINAPPMGGRLGRSPTQGVALRDKFTIVTSDWVDENDNLPITYDFSYSLDGSSYNTIQIRSSSNKAVTDFPSGYPSIGFEISLQCRAYDVFLASASVYGKVTVTSGRRLDSSLNQTSFLNSYLASHLNEAIRTYNPDLITGTVSNVAYSMNSNPCNLTSDDFCEKRNRKSCDLSNFPQTCSTCVDGYFGVFGDSNSPCSASIVGQLGDDCITDHDCRYNLCQNFVCKAPSMLCPSMTEEVCSGHGTCLYFDSKGDTIDTPCLITNLDCSAKCLCYEGYGSASCGYTSEEAIARSDTRDKLFAALLVSMKLYDESNKALRSLLEVLLITYDPSNAVKEINKSSHSQDAMKAIVDIAAKGAYLDERTNGLLVSLSSKFIDSSGSGNVSFSNYIISQISKGIVSTLINGQNAYSIAAPNLRMLFTKQFAYNLSKLEPPNTDEQIFYGQKTNSYLEISAGQGIYFDTGSAYVSIVLSLLGKNPNKGSFETISNMLLFESSALIKSNQSRYSEWRNPSFQSKNIGGSYDYYRTHQFTDKMNFSSDTNHTFKPSCAEYDTEMQQYVNSGNCNVLHYTTFNVTCGCIGVDHLDPSSVHAHRSLASGRSMDSVQLASLRVSVASVTVSSYSVGFNVPKGKPAIITISILIFVVLIAFSYFFFLDYQDRHGSAHSQDDTTIESKKHVTDQLLDEINFEESINIKKKCAEQRIYESNIIDVVSTFLDSVLPIDLIKEMESNSWTLYMEKLIPYHSYFSMFAKSSTRNTRVLRFTNCVFSILIILFIDTIFYADDGSTQSYAKNNPPPNTVFYILMVVMITIIISIPICFCFDYILWNYCTKRPDFVHWGYKPGSWFSKDKCNYVDHQLQLNSYFHSMEAEQSSNRDIKNHMGNRFDYSSFKSYLHLLSP